MKKILSICVLGAILFWISGCDELLPPYAKNVVGYCDTTKRARKILVEDYTGFTCGNCPKAAVVASQIHAAHPCQTIVIAVHAGYFAKPSRLSSSPYKYDFRTPTGDAWDIYFGNSLAGNPNGLIDRIKRKGTFIQPYLEWATIADSLLKLPADASITLQNSYDSTKHIVNVTANIEYFVPGISDHYIGVYLVEDNFNQWQEDYRLPTGSQDDSTYIHNHVLRAASNEGGVWGVQISASNFNAGKLSPIKTIISIPMDTVNNVIKPRWELKNCKVVAFIHNNSTKEVIQAEEQHVLVP